MCLVNVPRMFKLTTFCVFILSLVQTLDTKGKKRSELLELLLNQASKSPEDVKHTPPEFNSDKSTNIEVLLYIDSIDSINEARMNEIFIAWNWTPSLYCKHMLCLDSVTSFISKILPYPILIPKTIPTTNLKIEYPGKWDFTVSILLHLQWTDKRLVPFNVHKLFGNLTFLEIDSTNSKRIWVPDIFFPNEKKASFHDVMMANQMMRLYPSGKIVYISRLSMTLSCPMNLRNYPFDKQRCSVEIMSFGYTEDKLLLTWINASKPLEPVSVNTYVELPQFEVTGYGPGACQRSYHRTGNQSCLQANFYLERNIGYYVVQMYIPSVLIVMLSWISFWLTVNSVPGRISLGVLTVLTMTTQSTGVNNALPRVSYTKAIDVWMSTCLVFVFSALLEFAVVNVLSRKDDLNEFSLRGVFTIPKDLENGEVSVPLDPYSDPKPVRRGIVYAMYLDVASRIIFPTIFILFIICYWAYYIMQ